MRELDRPEHLRGPLKFYWVDTGSISGLLVVKDSDRIVDCPPYWQWHLLGRGLDELCEWNPRVRVRKLTEEEGWKQHKKLEREKKMWTGRRQ